MATTTMCLCRVVDMKAWEVDTCRGHYNSVFVSCCRREGLGGGHVSWPLQQCVYVFVSCCRREGLGDGHVSRHYNNVSLCHVVDVKAWEVDTCRGHYNNVSMCLCVML